MTEDNTPDHRSWIQHDNLTIRDDEFVVGAVKTEVKEGHHVEGSVKSYELGEFSRYEMNHVPRVVVVDTNSHVVADACANASPNAHEAIHNTRMAVLHAYRQLGKKVEK